MNKGYSMPNLSPKNLKAVEAIIRSMRDGDRCISDTLLRKIVCRSRGWNPYSHNLPQNYKNIKTYIVASGLATHTIQNGFSFWILTQKGFRSHWETIFPSDIMISQGQINTAVALCEQLYPYMEPAKFAEYITDNGTIPFKGATRTKFIELFKDWAAETDCPDDTFTMVLSKLKNVKVTKY